VCSLLWVVVLWVQVHHNIELIAKWLGIDIDEAVTHAESIITRRLFCMSLRVVATDGNTAKPIRLRVLRRSGSGSCWGSKARLIVI
jgi:hypothetical protein